MHRPVYVTYSSFIEGSHSHTTKKTAPGEGKQTRKIYKSDSIKSRKNLYLIKKVIIYKAAVGRTLSRLFQGKGFELRR
jgi:hypothetical protein